MRARVFIALVSLSLAACAVAPKHPAVQSLDLPEQLPVRDFVANTDFTGGHTVSPDGQQLVYQGVSRLRPAILWRDIDESSKLSVLRFKKGSPQPFWAADSRHILYADDASGRENYHVYAIDTLNPGRAPRDLTPFSNTRAYVAQIPSIASNVIHVMHNRRDATIFDLYQINLETAEETLLYENTDTVISLLIDDSGSVRARLRQSDTSRLLEVPDGSAWRTVVTATVFDDLYPLALSPSGDALQLISNVGRDKRVLSRLDLVTGQESIVYEHAEVDLGGVWISPRDKRPLIAFAEPDYPELHFFDDKFERNLKPFYKPGINGIDIMSLDRSESLATAVIYDHTGAEFHLLDLKSGESQPLGESPSRKHSEVWVQKRPIEFSASDGMQLHGYVSVPSGDRTGPVPTVLYVHGGPWARDGWGHDDMVQFLVNRGYAVLQVNYRGSSGYGREYMFAGEGEFAGSMHQDLIDAVDWSIEQGISDPENVAIMGGSYGGYATLVGMTMTPERFACGVDIVGVSDLISLQENVPAYWRPFMHLWERFVGDPTVAEDRERMKAKSPLYHAANAQNPLLILHGANDPRVHQDQSDRMVEALEQAGKPVDYVVIGDEGHGFGHWKNQLTLYRKTEDFLASCLGGRSSGFDFYQLGSWAF